MRFSIRSTMFALAIFAAPVTALAQIGVSITIAPPELPVYEQPAMPADGYLWTPGYWAYGDDGYYWVPGTWVQPPSVGVLWTPGYWGWSSGVYAFNAGYWGPHIGFYGGVNYGYGYGGSGYAGGRWNNGAISYNTSVNNIGRVSVHNTYNEAVVNVTVNRVSFNGGSEGVRAEPTAEERGFAHENHVAATSAQTQHEQAARANPEQRASVNHGRPALAATSTPSGAKAGGAEVKAANGDRAANTTRTPGEHAAPARAAPARTAPARAAAPPHAAAAVSHPQSAAALRAQEGLQTQRAPQPASEPHPAAQRQTPAQHESRPEEKPR